MGSIDEPGDHALSVLLRSNSIAMARVRTAQFRELRARKQSGRLRSLLFLHLKDELPAEDKDWIDCDNPKQLSPEEARRAQQELTSYRILKSLQSKLADMRTDLDSFSRVEAYALMVSGCSMVRTKFARAITGFRTQASTHSWKFLELDEPLREAKERTKYVARLLDAASQRAFKIWRLSPMLKALAAVLGLAGLGGLVWLLTLDELGDRSLLNVRGLVIAVLAALAGTIGLGALVKAIQYRKTVNQILGMAAFGLVGAIAAWIHLHIFDPLFLRWNEKRIFQPPVVRKDETGAQVEASYAGASPHRPPPAPAAASERTVNDDAHH
jgi:hypothetical protein